MVSVGCRARPASGVRGRSLNSCLGADEDGQDLRRPQFRRLCSSGAYVQVLRIEHVGTSITLSATSLPSACRRSGIQVTDERVIGGLR